MEENKILKFINSLKKSEEHKPYIENVIKIPSKKGEYAEEEYNLPEPLSNYLMGNKISLYTHQYEALDKIRNGHNVLITTSTASGKTLSFNIPIFEKMFNDPKATALYIYPTKALTNDQLKSLKNLECETEIVVKPEIYDGDTPKHKRPKIRNDSRIILMNPYELHHILQSNSKWKRFFKNLKYVVIDEAHTYRGIFGSNVAFLIRRLRRICNKYNSTPQFILSSATLANPLEFAEKLVGLEFKQIHKEGAPKNPKYFIFYNILKDEYSDISWPSSATDLLCNHINENIQTLAFAKSRKLTELIVFWTNQKLEKDERNKKGKIMPYRSGYDPKYRREVEANVKLKKLNAIVSTNALEAGIDIGSLDAVIMYGYPGTLMSFWQQAGRAGRANAPSVITYFADVSPLDQYVATHPEIVFKDTTENIAISLDNPNVIIGNILCAASEMPLTSKDEVFFTDELEELLDGLSESDGGMIAKTPQGYIYVNNVRASELVSLNAPFLNEFRILDENDKLIEVIDEAHAYSEAHEGAVFLNKGETYRITKMDVVNRKCWATLESVEYHTMAKSYTEIKVVDTLSKKQFNGFSITLNECMVNKQYYEYDKLIYGNKFSERPIPITVPPLTLNTIATSIQFKPEFFEEFKIYDWDIKEGIHAVEHAIVNVFPLHIMCDSHDIGGLISNYQFESDNPSIHIYDEIDGGSCLSEKAFEIPEKIIKTAYELVKDCKCKEGCPACIYSPNCGMGNLDLNKHYALKILKKMIENI
jgi:DEAD/DEAH box helicase domain-containing protein